MAEIWSGSSPSPEKRSVANALGRTALEDLVIDVAKDTALLIRHRAVIPDGNPIGTLQSLRSFDAVQSSAKLAPLDTESAADLSCRVTGIAPDDTRHTDEDGQCTSAARHRAGREPRS